MLCFIRYNSLLKGGSHHLLDLQPFTFGYNAYLLEGIDFHNRAETDFFLRWFHLTRQSRMLRVIGMIVIIRMTVILRITSVIGITVIIRMGW